ncbi:hypothetical protein L218DRAFT_949812 [Marasmius fiardii PR-910]|nr:hypothetical protein L218DRAFT_949812 [Marasmius fiardii PR-910]
MFSPKVITLFIVSMMMTSTAVVAKPGASTVAQMDSVENVPEDNSKTVHATSVTRSMGLAMIMAAWVSIKFAPLERSKDVLVTDLIGWKLGKGPPKESAAPYIPRSIQSLYEVHMSDLRRSGTETIKIYDHLSHESEPPESSKTLSRTSMLTDSQTHDFVPPCTVKCSGPDKMGTFYSRTFVSYERPQFMIFHFFEHSKPLHSPLEEYRYKGCTFNAYLSQLSLPTKNHTHPESPPSEYFPATRAD